MKNPIIELTAENFVAVPVWKETTAPCSLKCTQVINVLTFIKSKKAVVISPGEEKSGREYNRAVKL